MMNEKEMRKIVSSYEKEERKINSEIENKREVLREIKSSRYKIENILKGKTHRHNIGNIVWALDGKFYEILEVSKAKGKYLAKNICENLYWRGKRGKTVLSDKLILHRIKTDTKICSIEEDGVRID